uniref:Venom s1 protease with cub domain 7 n=1 Tax=Pristhesancus plagipennis TaxID=1955184 RepID=A0A1Q1NPL1_PRIPG|nr:venom s1 protease with cub domain 7 [Pristhesancus plagipennis]
MSAVYIAVQILLAALCLTNADENVKVIKGIYSKLETPNYPQVYNTNGTLTWKFEAEGDDEKLKLHCDDFRLIETEDCSLVSVEIDDGTNKKSYCGTQDTLRLISTSNKFTVTLKGEDEYGQGVFSCIVKTLEPVSEVVELSINKLYHFKGPIEPTPYFDKLWHFKTAEGQKVELKCYINVIEENDGAPCFEEVLTVDLGDGPQEFCGYDEKIFFSKGNEAKLRLELGNDGAGEFHCAAQAVVKEDPITADLAENVARTLDEDSSEHGGPEGKKSTSCKCGWANKGRARIINGREASPNEYPWIVALKAYFGEAFINCGGSIVTQRHVLTAAHCLVNMYVDMAEVKPQDVIVYTGAHNLNKLSPSVRQYKAEKIFVRPEFIKQYTHDFAMVVVDSDIEFSQTVGPICLSPKRIAEINQKITILGWGKTQTGNPSPVLMKAKTAVIDPRKCNDINPWEVCTRAKPSATCTGDSGGPLSWLDPETNRYTLMSLVSYGDPDCVSSPSVSTDIAFFYNWVQEKIKATYPNLVTCAKK